VFRHDCSQRCSQAAGQHPTRVDNPGISAQPTTGDGPFWTMCPLLRIRRLGVRVPPSAPRSEPLSASGRGSFANTLANGGTLGGGRYGAGEDVGGLGELVADDMGVHAQRDRGVRMAERGGDHVHGDASQQQGAGVDADGAGSVWTSDPCGLRSAQAVGQLGNYLRSREPFGPERRALSGPNGRDQAGARPERVANL
jgi:hypothetical protein